MGSSEGDGAQGRAIAANVTAVRTRIAAAAKRGGRDPSSVKLIAVSKTHSVSAIRAAHDAGLRDFGENRVQEAAAKIIAFRAAGLRARWHLLGHLQRNKARVATDLFDILHGIDSEGIARNLDIRAAAPIRVLLEVNVAGEASKFGVTMEAAPEIAQRIRRLSNIELVGLMTVAPRVDHANEVRPVFRSLRKLGVRLGLPELSMGMSDDFEVAIQEGATMVRVGRAVFGAREG